MQKDFISLELDKILEMLSGYTACEDARSLALGISPESDFLEVIRLLSQTEAAHILIAKFGAPSFGGLVNIDNSLRRAQAGGSLNMHELLEISQVLRVIDAIVGWHEKSASSETELDDLFSSLYRNKYLEEKISNAIISETEMSDNASSELRDIRRKIRLSQSKIRDKLDEILHSQHYKNSLQDAIITQRNGRFVIPVKNEHRAEISGMVHDTSSSGATVFIEPAAVVQANNEIKVLESKERDEIERILYELSAEAAEFADALIVSYQSAVQLNLIFSKAQLAFSMKATKPVINDRGVINLKNAVHPLLDKKTAVPICVNLGDSFDSLIITGPNTGGKTVSVKTIGLLTLMAECGLFIPADDKSEISVFDHILCDIGEEQSIEQSLSTFSAHMTKIVEIIKTADKRSLVLIDELGAGTDPVEGAALAVAILEHLHKQGAKIAATTHYAELKEYAINTKRVENASCEFDVDSLKPTYKLLIGIPGRSNAFAISKRLQLPDEIITEAQSLVSSENTRFEDVVDTLENTRLEMEEEKRKSLEMQAEIERLKASAEEKLKRAEQRSEKEVEKARLQAQKIVENARRAANSLMLEIDMLKKEQKKEKDAAALARKARASMRSHLNNIDDITSEELYEEDDETYVLPRELKAGDTVFVTTLGTKGEITKLIGNTAEISAGIIKTKVDIKALRLIENADKKPQNSSHAKRSGGEETAKSVGTSVDLRGMDREEALMELDRYIDSVVRMGISDITIIHGKGTGVLRKAVAAHLRRHPNVRTFRLGVYGEGEDGVTIATLK